MPASDSERAPGQGRPNSQKLWKQKQRYSISVETQAAFFLLLPIVLIVAILAIAEARQ